MILNNTSDNTKKAEVSNKPFNLYDSIPVTKVQNIKFDVSVNIMSRIGGKIEKLEDLMESRGWRGGKERKHDTPLLNFSTYEFYKSFCDIKQMEKEIEEISTECEKINFKTIGNEEQEIEK